MEKGGNHLVGQRSPYLIEHEHDPVDWYPWCDEAFAKARKENKPLFISIGYSTCHWCHVMQKESFQDNEVAELLNKTFVCIKVDREERPDVDNVYMKVCQMMTGSGGWPLTVIATPEKRPFYVTTYVPKEPRFNMIGVKDLVENVAAAWENDRNAILKNAQSLEDAISKDKKRTVEKLGSKIFDDAFKKMSEMFDFDNGGFGEAPKFPMALNLMFMLRYWHATQSKLSLSMVERTLECMRMGGVYDQIGGGFHRYATDMMWNVPHFEKMLYDQALISMVYLEAFQITNKSSYEWTARETLDFVIRELSSKEGAFYTALDADSDDLEGKFYTFTYDEIYNTLGPGDRELFFSVYPVKESQGIVALHMDDKPEAVANELKIDFDTMKKRLDIARNKLFALRIKRTRPNTDDKILADMNGLMIAALSKASIALNDERYLSAAKSAADFVIGEMVKGGKLLHMHGSNMEGYLTDYAFMSWGLTGLYEASFDSQYLEKALVLMEEVQKHFIDKETGSFYSTSDESEVVLVRDRQTFDNAVPSGNSAALYALLALSRLTGIPKLEVSAGRLSDALSGALAKNPSYAPFALSALFLALRKSYEVVIVSGRKSDSIKFAGQIRKGFNPSLFIVIKDKEIDRLTEFTRTMEPVSGKATAYVCTGNVCQSALVEPKKVIEAISEK